MGLKYKLLYATILASSCFFSTSYVVKADQVNVNVESNDSQNTKTDTQNALDTADTDSQVTTKDNSTEVDSEKSPDQTTDQVQTDPTQVQDAQTTDNNQVINNEAIDGVYTTGNQLVSLYNADGSKVMDRGLSANSAWYTDTRNTMTDGSTYYRVSTTEFVNGKDGSYQSYVQPYQGDATIVYKTGSSAHSFQGYGNKAVYTGENLPTGSSWKVSNHALIGGKDWYQIGVNTWVPQDYVVINNGQYKDADWITGVPLIAQRPELPNGCEITAVTMMMQYAGAKVDKMEMAREMPRSSNPNYGYIGNHGIQLELLFFHQL